MVSEHLELQTDRHNGDGGSGRREYDDDDKHVQGGRSVRR